MLHKADYVDEGVPLVNPTNMVNNRIVLDRSMLISETTRNRLSRYILREGDIVVARRGEIGRCAIVGPEEAGWLCGTGSFFIRPLPQTSPQFLTYQLLSPKYRERLEAASTGTTMKNLSNTTLSELQISLPPLPEQQRIVALLDDAFEGIATAKTNAEKNLKNARELFESHLQAVFTQRGEGWEETTLGEVCDFKGGGTPSKAVERYWQGNIPWVSPKDMKFEVVSDSIDHISEEAIKNSATSLIPEGAVLIVVRSGILARIVPVALAGRELTINQDLKALCPKSMVEPRFLYCLLESMMPVLLSMVTRGATVHRLMTDQIRALAFPLPPRAAQQSIIERVDLMRDETQRLEAIYQQKLAALDELKKSLLHKAFSGEL
ncbi:MAG: restriction endonuclease subunit S [Desulfovibrio sp.]